MGFAIHSNNVRSTTQWIRVRHSLSEEKGMESKSQLILENCEYHSIFLRKNYVCSKLVTNRFSSLSKQYIDGDNSHYG